MSKSIPRPPVVAILGHVDHGKTSLLDYIRKSRIAHKEIGGITQRIGAYEIKSGIKGYPTDKITFIDTPGHEAFSQIRARGAKVADIAILIIDAKDSIMPQTIESIAHIKAANIPLIVAINKIDLPDANIEKVKNDLAKHQVFVEGKGGETVVVPISAKVGTGVNDLLEAIHLLASSLDFKYSIENPAQAYVIETKKGKQGIVVTVIIKDGQLKQGDKIHSHKEEIKIRSMINDLGKVIMLAEPSTPFEILGFNQMPDVGTVITHEVQLSEAKKTEKIEKKFDLESILKPEKEEKKLLLIIKADSQGSLEAVTSALSKKKNIDLVLTMVGNINKSDIFLAKTTKAIVVGFSVVADHDIIELAKQEKVIIKTYNLIYELLKELSEVADILKEKEQKEKNYKGEAKILASFLINKEAVFGIKVTKGKINLGDQIEVYRGDRFMGTTKLVSLRIRAKVVPEVKKDQEGGMVFGGLLDIKVGDVIKSIL